MKSLVRKLFAKILFKVMHSKEYKALLNSYFENNLLNQFKIFGSNSVLPQPCTIMNPKYISIGKNFNALYNLRIEAWDEYMGESFSPEIIIGDNVNFNTDCHIGCINKVTIGNNVLLASRIYISDHFHGKISGEESLISPAKRKLYSKGPVIIKDNVWIGEGVCVMPGVTIGENSIIGANAVVTKDIPANCVASGVPAKVLKHLSE